MTVLAPFLAHSPELAIYMLIAVAIILLFPVMMVLGIILPPLYLLRPRSRPQRKRKPLLVLLTLTLNALALLYCLFVSFFFGNGCKLHPLLAPLCMAFIFIGAEGLVFWLRRRWCQKTDARQTALPPIPEP